MQVTSRTRQTAGYLLLAALATVFLFLLDELLGWLGWQLVQTPLLDGLALAFALLLVPVAVWWLLSQHMDWLDRGGTLLGCALGGAFLACYTVFPPAGVVTLLIFALCVGYAMLSNQAQHMMIVAAMVVSFVAVSFLVNDWRHGDERLIQIDPQPQHIYYVTQQTDTPHTQTRYQCQRPGIFCQSVAVSAADTSSVRSSWLSGGVGANLSSQSRP